MIVPIEAYFVYIDRKEVQRPFKNEEIQKTVRGYSIIELDLFGKHEDAKTLHMNDRHIWEGGAKEEYREEELVKVGE